MIDTKTQVLIGNTGDITRATWVSLPITDDEFEDKLQEIGVSRDEDPYEMMASGQDFNTYTILDCDSDILCKGDIHDIFEASELIEEIEGLEPYELDAVHALQDDGDDIYDAVEAVTKGDVTFYPDVDLTELAEQFGDEGMFSQEYLLEHVDWESIGRDMSYEGYSEVNGGVLYRY